MARPQTDMLIRNAEIWDHGFGAVRIMDGLITGIGVLAPAEGETVLDALGGALLPGLHDHHIHLAALAARRASLWCGPPEISTRDQLAEALAGPGTGWIRGIGYHESVLGGLPTAAQLDELVRERPLRMQHRSGRMWLLNSAALAELLSHTPPPPGLERDDRGWTGRLFDEDAWLRSALASAPPDLAHASHELAACGITGVTDMTPGNDPAMARHFARQMDASALLQHCHLAGRLSLGDAEQGPWHLGPAKLHLHEAALPEFEQAVQFIRSAHDRRRPVAVHCVSEVELVFTLALFEEAGTTRGDRIEHASVASAALVERMAALGLWVCTQPHFIAERGDRYLADVEPRHHRDLYRLRSLITAGLPLASGSDAPFGSVDPWAAMAAAVSRRTADGRQIALNEALSPEQAIALYLRDPADLTRERRIEAGAPADICLLDRPWREARERLTRADVRAVFVSGRLVHDRIDQSPGERLPG